MGCGAIFGSTNDEEEEEDAPPPFDVQREDPIRISSVSHPDRTWHQQNFEMFLDVISMDRIFLQDSGFRIRPGIAGTGISFESISCPGFFLCSLNFECHIREIPEDLDEQMGMPEDEPLEKLWADASFHVREPLDPSQTSRCASFESVSCEGYYIHHQEFRLRITHFSDGSDTFNLDATWREEDGEEALLGTSLPQVDLIEEGDVVPVDPSVVPSHWIHSKRGGARAFDDLFYVDQKWFHVFDEMLKTTYKPRVTQDRKCPTDEHGRVRGGCPCVQPGGSPGLPVEYRTRQVIRVEDSGMWGNYIEKVKSIQIKRNGESFRQFQPPIMSDEVADSCPELFAPLDNNLNEVYLFHGTRVRYALSIAQDDFNIDLAGNNRGTMYGAGAYLAESSTKADEYAADDKDGYYQGICTLLLCRVCMGKMYYTRKRNEAAGERIADGSHDSTCGDRSGPPIDTFRELVVYDADQLYPEYIILYQRVSEDDDKDQLEEMLKTPFRLPFPLYWTNVHKDPDDGANPGEGFAEQYLVREDTRCSLQELVLKSMQSFSWSISKARRVENAHLWQRYVSNKMTCLEKMSEEELDSFEDLLQGEQDPKHVLAIMSGNTDVERFISVRDMDQRLNERLFWHGGPKDCMEWSALGFEHGEDILWPLGSARFCCDINRSIQDAAPDDEGLRYILLCRVVLGQCRCVEVEQDDAISNMDLDRSEQESVIIRCEGQADQVLISTVDQVYVEYIIELADIEADVLDE